MGVQCSSLNPYKCCPIEQGNLKIENIENKYEDNDNNHKENENPCSMQNIITIKSKKSPLSNKLSHNENELTFAQKNLISNLEKYKGVTLKKTKTAGFSDFMSDISFNNFKTVDKNDIFETNYISLKDNYNEEMINYLNKIRNEPKSIIEDIDNLLKEENNQDQKISIEKDETHENIIFEDEGTALKKAKIFLSKAKAIDNKLNLNDDLIIDNSEFDEKIDNNLNKKITKILVDKRKNLIKVYPNCQFFVNFIKDVKINLLYLLSQNEDKSNFRDVLFDNKFKDFNVTCIKEKNNKFISFLCFA